jgi:hypothetical protein
VLSSRVLIVGKLSEGIGSEESGYLRSNRSSAIECVITRSIIAIAGSLRAEDIGGSEADMGMSIF